MWIFLLQIHNFFTLQLKNDIQLIEFVLENYQEAALYLIINITEYQPTHKIHFQLFSLHHLYWLTYLTPADQLNSAKPRWLQAYLLLDVMLVRVVDWTRWDYNHLKRSFPELEFAIANTIHLNLSKFQFP